MDYTACRERGHLVSNITDKKIKILRFNSPNRCIRILKINTFVKGKLTLKKKI